MAAALELVPPPLQADAPVGRQRLRLSIRRGPGLRRRLVALDALAVTVAWLASWPVAAGHDDRGLTDASVLLGVATVTVVALFAAASQHLYLARVSSVRAYEVVRLGRVAFVSAMAALLVDASQVSQLSLGRLVVGGVLAFALLATLRGWFSRWLRAHRARGAFTRPMVVVANGDDAANLIALLQDHPEMGFVPAGLVGDRPETAGAEVSDVRWLGQTQDTLGIVAQTGATGVIIAAGALPSDQLNRLVRDLHQANVHVHLSSGLTGFHHRRLRMAPMAHEPLLYLEAMALSRAQLAAKRALDLIVASVLLVLALPVLAAAAVAIKTTSPGPVLFRQQRVGRHGRLFTVLKLRTMHCDAEMRLDEVRHLNQRSGPLFKLDRDPRVTRVGRVLRDTSIDELPQLLNVLAGTMSMVGPRPALPDEVARFDDDLLERHQVLPGVSGLWQVEARDNASFSAYRRLDLFYAENWSIGLDLAVLMATVQAVLGRALRLLPAPAALQRLGRGREAAVQPAVPAFEAGQ